MQAGIVELNARRVKDGKEPIAVGIGVNAGEVIAGRWARTTAWSTR